MPASAAVVHAADADEGVPVRVEWSAHEGCPSSESFLAEVRERAPRVRGAEEGEPAPTLRVRIVRRGAESVGAVDIVEPDGTNTAPKEVRGARCEDVASALAITSALALDPTALVGAPPQPAPAPSSSASAREVAPVASASATPAPAPVDGPRVFVEASAETATAIGPRLLVGGAAGVGVASRRRAGPDVSLSFVGLGDPFAHVDDARFALFEARVRGCAPGLALGDAVAIAPCVLVDVGALRASGRDVASPRTDTSPWVDVGGSVRLRADLGPTLALLVGGGAFVPLTRSRFVYDEPVRFVYETRNVGVFGSLGLVFHFS